MVLSSLIFSGLSWLWPVLVMVAVILALVGWSYRAAPAGGVRWTCVALKAAGLAALAICLLEPLWSGQRARPGANVIALVADNSQSLQIRDAGESQSRWETLRALLDPARAGWLGTLAEQFDVRRFTFDARLQAVRDFSELAGDGRASAIGAVLRTLPERLAGRPVAGVLLFTDGNATDLGAGMPALAGLPPVYPVVLGRSGAVRDVGVAHVQVSQTAFERAPVSAQASVRATGYRGENITARLVDAAGRVQQEQTLRARNDQEQLAFQFRWRPEQPGVSFYQIRVGAAADSAPGRAAVGESGAEATLANNTQVLAVDRGRGPYRVLYVAGRPNWEYKFLNRALMEDDQVQLVALLRVALREPKFEFRGRAGETGNPLFRGFGDQSREEVERYDQPVLIRLNTRDELELRGGFPRTAEDLYAYHAVILDDVEAAFFSPDQATLVQKFVSERGGGFLMLGGAESFHQGQYQRTPIGDILPVYLDREEPPHPTGPLKLNLAREGWLESWARLRETETDEKTRIQAMPPFQVLNPASDLKPGASRVATVTDEAGKEHPALVTQRFGRGRTAALLVGDLWRWGMQHRDARRDLDQMWRQLVRWLVADVPARVELAAEPGPDEGSGAVRLQVRVRDPQFQPMDDAAVTVEVQPVLSSAAGALTNRIRLRAEPAPQEAGVYETTYVPRVAGGFLAIASVTNQVGAEVGRAETGWSYDPAADEFRSLEPNLGLLNELAQRTGGRVLSPSELDSFTRRLPELKAPVMEAWTVPAWHTPLWFLFALGCLITEWGLRRWRGLP